MNIGLVGMPNVGKTALFNALTGSFQKVANFPGVTVEKKVARLQLSLQAVPDLELVDLPGLYSLDVATLDEKVTRDWLLKQSSPLLFVLDSTNLQKSLYLLLQLLELGHRPLIALTQTDQAEKLGQRLDLQKFAELTGCEAYAVSAATGKGIEELKQALVKYATKDTVAISPVTTDYQSRIKQPQYVREKFRTINDWIRQFVTAPIREDSFTKRLDQLVIHPLWGFGILLLVLFVMFQALFSWASPLQDAIESAVTLLSDQVGAVVTQSILKSLLVEGIIGGVGSVIVFLPQIVLMFVFIQVLEDFGYLSRVAFLLDGFMRKLGLPGKAIVPMLSGHACAIPAILSTRILEDRRERLISMLVIPITTCSARLPVFTLLVAALIPKELGWGFVSYQGLFMMALYLFPMAMAILVAAILRKTLPHSAPSMLLMEMPAYRIPKLKNILRTITTQSRVFLGNAGKIILVFSLIIWGLVAFPRHESGEALPIDQSYAAMVGKVFTPIFAPLGFDWKINTALIPAFGAREVLVSALGTVYSVEGDEESQLNGLSQVLGTDYSLATLAALLVWFIFAPQCMSTVAVLRRESGGWSIPVLMVAYTLALAWVMAFLTYQLLR